jgi:hypothetical protein
MIRNIIAIAATAFCAYVSTASARLSTDTVDVIDNSIGNSIDSETVNAAVDDTGSNIVKADSIDTGNIDAINLDDDELLQAALSADSVKTVPSMQKLDLIRREHEYKKQTRAAIIMMIFIAAAMATSQSWNPR